MEVLNRIIYTSQFCTGSAGTWIPLLCSQGSEIHTLSSVSIDFLRERLVIYNGLLRTVVPDVAGISVAVYPNYDPLRRMYTRGNWALDPDVHESGLLRT